MPSDRVTEEVESLIQSIIPYHDTDLKYGSGLEHINISFLPKDSQGLLIIFSSCEEFMAKNLQCLIMAQEFLPSGGK